MSYRVIALDLDGTLLDPQKKILPESLAALNEARRQGVKVLIVTGRHHVAIHPFYQALNLDTPAICCNGTYLYDYLGKKVLASDPMTLESATQMIERLRDTDIQHLMYVDDAMLYNAPTEGIKRTLSWAETLPEAQRPNIQFVENYADVMHDYQSIWKFAVSSENLDQLKEVVHGIETDFGLECEWSWVDQVDIGRKGNSKGLRLKQWVESQGMTMDDVVAFGDNFNDLSMLTTAGLGVAMGNAVDEIKQQAKLVTRDNTQPGIAEVIRKYVL
ncbi:pyridoxal phosphatase [Providencia vermicola]|uniref:Pyridoxal phosphatase n=2 Tax=Providencia TaxID=586 RepID=A0AAI9I0J0_PROST|nr:MULTISPECIES: pyridoxal phosphatase [Providencia]ELR5043961.1 pyridoxal phosphatase [Providencia rettgeri]ELR5036118.1 pyridoxal phosphatase [Providencia stuartii]ELR5120740.1 pyridoxal phosphatase [Providencia stuartii]ELR5293327.1 pyridoxal phosphatase [Providencia stuartii]ELX8380263.1 pyridoxal phosphatase [Providencia stuartii]